MKIELFQNGRALRKVYHEGIFYVEAPPEGEFEIELTNDQMKRQLAVVTVDGRNICDGEPGSINGPGYVMDPLMIMRIPGWRRDDNNVARFSFEVGQDIYAEAIGDGSKNVGVIGLAVFSEKRRYRAPIRHSSGGQQVNTSRHRTRYSVLRGVGVNNEATTADGPSFLDMADITCSTDNGTPICAASCPPAAEAGQVCSRSPEAIPASEEIFDVGTGYGKEDTFHTKTVTFDRQDTPDNVLSIRYAVRARLESWGIPLAEPIPDASAFPRDRISVKAPPGWDE